MIVYVETSAAVKLLFEEAESVALALHIDDLTDGEIPLLCGDLLEVELRRVAQRRGATQQDVTNILERFDLLAMDQSIYRTAGLLPGENLRSLDALHIAVALRVSADVMVTYDQRQIEACRSVGLNTLSPR
ncbi:MAG: type II toxin-antitoxin system VapC family toxin [Lacisediminihabitans sp.]